MLLSQRFSACLMALTFCEHVGAEVDHFPDMLSAKVQRRDNSNNNNNTNESIDDATRHPNATGSWPIHGIDVTKPLRDPPPDEYGRGNGWTIDIAVATNITTTDSESRSNPQDLNLKAPDNAFSETDQMVNATVGITPSHDRTTPTTQRKSAQIG
ncbi:hypothetical protein QIS74_11324 [Colletotrichum tabaci]|uniref:Uncharacterized protein n=1 Tax=Colletotrichum tabaci TaxID=1209068 RepID=A0AAV9SXT6_9PEZI